MDGDIALVVARADTADLRRQRFDAGGAADQGDDVATPQHRVGQQWQLQALAADGADIAAHPVGTDQQCLDLVDGLAGQPRRSQDDIGIAGGEGHAVGVVHLRAYPLVELGHGLAQGVDAKDIAALQAQLRITLEDAPVTNHPFHTQCGVQRLDVGDALA